MYDKTTRDVMLGIINDMVFQVEKCKGKLKAYPELQEAIGHVGREALNGQLQGLRYTLEIIHDELADGVNGCHCQ
jgi:hypothetical protein